MNNSSAVAEIAGTIVLWILFFFHIDMVKRESVKQRLNKYVLILLASSASALLFSAITAILGSSGAGVGAIKLFWLLRFIFASAAIGAFHAYLVNFIEDRSPKSFSKVLKFIAWGICFVMIIMWGISLKTGWFYTIDQSGAAYTEYKWIGYLGFMVTYIIDMGLLVKFSDRIGIKNLIVFLLYIILPVISSTVEFLAPSLSLVYPAIGVSAILGYVMITIDERDKAYALEKKTAQEAKEAVEYGNKLMISQLRPHFLFNVISSIMLMCRKDPAKAVDTLSDFADYLRVNLQVVQNDVIIPFGVELEHVEAYLRLEKNRFKDKLQIEYDVQATDFSLPLLSAQPLAENAVKHGISKKKEGGKLIFRTYEDQENYIVEVIDDGLGFDVNNPPDDGKVHSGFIGITKRLNLCPGARFDIESEPGKGTKASLFIPKEKKGLEKAEN